jgi:hypothetical protein
MLRYTRPKTTTTVNWIYKKIILVIVQAINYNDCRATAFPMIRRLFRHNFISTNTITTHIARAYERTTRSHRGQFKSSLAAKVTAKLQDDCRPSWSFLYFICGVWD